MSPTIRRIALQITLLLTVGASALSAQVSFTDVTADHGLDEFVYDGAGGHALGACWVDFDNDDWPDLFITNGFNHSPHLYRNDLGGVSGTFVNSDELLPVFPQVEMMGCAFADYDNDGDDDIYIFTDNEDQRLHDETNPPDGPVNILLKNNWVENQGQLPLGVPLFEDVTASAGLLDMPESPFGEYPAYRSTSGGWLDYDRDGFTDLYVAHWQTAHGGEDTNKDRLYRNNGDGTFTDVSVASGIQPGTDPTTYRPALAFIAAHLDDDNWQDLYVVNVHDESPYHHDMYFRNNKDGTFSDFTDASPGLGDDSGAGMGIDIADVELDGDWDIYISDIVGNDIDASLGNAFYYGDGNGGFSDNMAPEAGVFGVTSWGVAFFDADLDGYEDLFVGAAGPLLTSILYHNDGDGTFTDITDTAGVGLSLGARGVATADYDRDGDMDFIVVNTDANVVQLYRNDYIGGSSPSGANNWLKVKLTPTISNLSGIGAQVRVRLTDGGDVLKRQIIGGNNTHSQDEKALHFGVGALSEVFRVRVIWPSGAITEVDAVPVNQELEISEPEVATTFTDVTVEANLFYEHGYFDGINGPPRRIAAGVAAGDYDNDGWVDLYIERGTIGPNVLMRNLGNGTFEEVAATGGIELSDHKGSGPTFGDIDGDGLLDLFVGSVDGDQPKFFRNLGNDAFEDITAVADITSDRNTFSAAFADYNEDGLLDLGLTHWDTGDNPCLEPCTGHLWRNNGDYTFTDDDVNVGITGYEDDDRGFTPNWTDITGDGKLDLVVASDFGTSKVFHNNGDGTFTNVTDPLVITDQNGMGGTVGDYDGDLDIDWFVSSIYNPDNDPPQTGNRMYGNQTVVGGEFGGAGVFADVTDAAGVRDGSWGWGACFADFNNDARLDLFHVNGFASPPYDTDQSRLFMNLGSSTFAEVSTVSGLVETDAGRGVVCFDYDHDGDIDVFVSNNSTQVRMWRNDTQDVGNFLNVSLRSRTKNVYGIGAKIYATFGGTSQVREISAGSNFVSQNPSEAHFGLGAAEGVTGTVEVLWPGGITNVYEDVAVDQFVELKQVYDSIGLYDPGRSGFFLRNTNDGGGVDMRFRYFSDRIPLSGDWDGSGIDRVGVYDVATGRFDLRSTNERRGTTLFSFTFGPGGPDWLPVAGDWDGDGADSIGVYNTVTREFRLRNENSEGPADYVFQVGSGDWLPIAGDWDGDGADGIGIYEQASGRFKLKNELANGGADHSFVFEGGSADHLPLAGDWDGDRIDSVGIYDVALSEFALTNMNAGGAPDLQFVWGSPRGWAPLAGMWN